MNIKTADKKPHIWLSTAHFINDVYTGMLNPIMPFIAAKLGISMAIATVVLSVSHICSSLLQPIFGFFADNILKRVFIFWGLMFTAVFISFAPGVNHLSLLILFIILGSLGSSLFHPQALGFSVRFASEDAGKSMGTFIAMGTFGYSLGPVVSAFVTQFTGLSNMPYLCLMGVVWALCMFNFVPKISDKKVERTHSEFVKAFKDIFSNYRLKLLILISILKSLITTSTSILLPFLWRDMGYLPFKIGAALFAFSFMSGIGSFISRDIEKRIGAKKVFYFSMISTLPLMVLFALTYEPLPAASFVIFALMGLCTAMAMPVTMVMAQSEMPQYKSIIGGFINGFSWGVIAIFMSAIGFVAQAKGIIPVLLVVSLIPAVLSFYILNKLFKKSEQ